MFSEVGGHSGTEGVDWGKPKLYPQSGISKRSSYPDHIRISRLSSYRPAAAASVPKTRLGVNKVKPWI